MSEHEYSKDGQSRIEDVDVLPDGLGRTVIITFHALVCYSISFYLKSKTSKIKLVNRRL